MTLRRRSAPPSGAWIETGSKQRSGGIPTVAPLHRAERGLKPDDSDHHAPADGVAPLHRAERGLKHLQDEGQRHQQGRSAPPSGAWIETEAEKLISVGSPVAPLHRAERGLKHVGNVDSEDRTGRSAPPSGAWIETPSVVSQTLHLRRRSAPPSGGESARFRQKNHLQTILAGMEGLEGLADESAWAGPAC